MCGIIGYIGNKNAEPILLDGLKRLEYRGYDSAGIAVIEQGKLKITKAKGKIENLKKKIYCNPSKATIGIGHTRWATHGEPSEKNAHPHTDSTNEIAIVHNGIIENYASLKNQLQKEGIIFVSDTDSEVVAHLVKKFYNGNLESAVQKTLQIIKGAYGLAVISKNEEKIVAAKKSSPLVIGIGENGYLISSDSSAIIHLAKNIIYLEDDELVVITKNSCVVKDLNGKLIEKKIKKSDNLLQEAKKGNYAHFMLKEIFEQPSALKNTLAGRVKNGKIKLSLSVDFKQVERIIIIGCGTSYHSGLIGKYLLEKIACISTEVEYASEFRYRKMLLRKTDLVVAISQSGETADTIAALRKAKQHSAKTIGIVNTVGSTISREVDSGIYLHCGPEIGVASTKAFTTQVACLTVLALYIAQQKRILTILSKELEIIPKKVAESLKEFDKIKDISKLLKNTKLFLYLGRGFNYPVALEGALKLKEIAYVSAEGYPTAEMKHGPLALIDDKTWSIFLVSKNSQFEKTLSSMAEIKARNGKILAITNTKNNELQGLVDLIINVPLVPEELEPIINIIPLQLLAYCVANEKGLDVDKPRNLAKSVTVE